MSYEFRVDDVRVGSAIVNSDDGDIREGFMDGAVNGIQVIAYSELESSIWKSFATKMSGPVLGLGVDFWCSFVSLLRPGIPPRFPLQWHRGKVDADVCLVGEILDFSYRNEMLIRTICPFWRVTDSTEVDPSTWDIMIHLENSLIPATEDMSNFTVGCKVAIECRLCVSIPGIN